MGNGYSISTYFCCLDGTCVYLRPDPFVRLQRAFRNRRYADQLASIKAKGNCVITIQRAWRKKFYTVGECDDCRLLMHVRDFERRYINKFCAICYDKWNRIEEEYWAEVEQEDEHWMDMYQEAEAKRRRAAKKKRLAREQAERAERLALADAVREQADSASSAPTACTDKPAASAETTAAVCERRWSTTVAMPTGLLVGTLAAMCV